MKVKKFNSWLESDSKSTYNINNVQNILNNKYNHNVDIKKLKDFKDNVISKDKNEIDDDYFAKRYLEFTRNKYRLTPPFQNDLIMNNDFYARAFYDEVSANNDIGKPIKGLQENINNDIIWEWKNDSLGFEPQYIIDKNDEPNYYINANYNKSGDFIIIIYGENISGHYYNSDEYEYEVEIFVVDKKNVSKYILNTTDNIDEDDFFKYSNLSYDDKKDNIKIALSLLEIIGEATKVIGAKTKKDAREIAHNYFISKINEDGVASVSGSSVSGMGAVVTSQPSSIPGNVSAATTGSGDIGSGWNTSKNLNRNVIPRPTGSRRKNKMKAKAKEMLKNFSNQFKNTEYKKGGDKDAHIMKFSDFSK